MRCGVAQPSRLSCSASRRRLLFLSPSHSAFHVPRSAFARGFQFSAFQLSALDCPQSQMSCQSCTRASHTGSDKYGVTRSLIRLSCGMSWTARARYQRAIALREPSTVEAHWLFNTRNCPFTAGGEIRHDLPWPANHAAALDSVAARGSAKREPKWSVPCDV